MKYESGKSYIEFDTDMMDDTALEIEMVYVDPAERGQKKGYRLLNKAIEYARENGYKSVTLCAYPQEDDGITEEALVEYYRAYGFESDGDCDALMTKAI